MSVDVSTESEDNMAKAKVYATNLGGLLGTGRPAITREVG